MNGIEKILERINSDADNEIAKLQNDTRAECDAIKAKAEEDAKAAREAALQLGAQKSEEKSRRAHSAADMAAKKEILAVKREMIDAAFDKAVEQLCALPQEEYEQLLAKLVAGAAEGTEKVVFSTTDRARVGKKVVVAANALLEEKGKTGALTLSEETREMKGGIVLKEGRIETNCSFEALIEFNKTKLMGEVAEILFS